MAKAKAWQAQTEYQRIEKMYKAGAATQQAYDNVKASYQMAKAQEGASCKQFSAMAAQKSTTHLQTNVHYAQIDLCRNDKVEPIMNAVYAKDSGRLAQKRTFDKNSYLLPIPQTALDKNNNLIQNPGY